MKKILISCGEPSGDLYAGALAREIRSLDSTIEIFGLGGEQLQAASAELVADYHGLTVTGLSEALAVLPRSYSTYRKIVARAAADPPAVFVAVDFPDFNFRLAAAIRALGIPIVYYIGPQVWAWRRRRLRGMCHPRVFGYSHRSSRQPGSCVDFFCQNSQPSRRRW